MIELPEKYFSAEKPKFRIQASLYLCMNEYEGMKMKGMRVMIT